MNSQQRAFRSRGKVIHCSLVLENTDRPGVFKKHHMDPPRRVLDPQRGMTKAQKKAEKKINRRATLEAKGLWRG